MPHSSGNASPLPRRAAVDEPGRDRARAFMAARPRRSTVTPRGLVAVVVAGTVVALGIAISQVPGASAQVAFASPTSLPSNVVSADDLRALAASVTPTPSVAPVDVVDVAPLDSSVVPTPEAATPTPEVATPSQEPVAAEALVTSTGLNLRAGPESSSELIVVLAEGTTVSATTTQGDWRQVSVGERTGWVKTAYLTSAQAYAATRTASPSASPKASSGTVAGSYPACSKGSAVEATLTPRADTVHRAVCATFPGVSSFQNRGTGDEHGTGRAIDVMTSGAYGREIAAWLRANASSLGVVEIIYEQKIWTTQRASEGWRAMSDRGSTTANHYDHVHVLVS